MSLLPKYLSREFGQVFITAVYTHPKSNTARAATEIADVFRSLQRISPDAPNFVLDDFNSCDLRTALLAFKLYVTCATRLEGKPDRCYGKSTYRKLASLFSSLRSVYLITKLSI